jgi:hypothetical protein
MTKKPRRFLSLLAAFTSPSKEVGRKLCVSSIVL